MKSAGNHRSLCTERLELKVREYYKSAQNPNRGKGGKGYTQRNIKAAQVDQRLPALWWCAYIAIGVDISKTRNKVAFSSGVRGAGIFSFDRPASESALKV